MFDPYLHKFEDWFLSFIETDESMLEKLESGLYKECSLNLALESFKAGVEYGYQLKTKNIS